MRLLSVSCSNGQLSVAANTSNANDIHGFCVHLMESQPTRLRFRSVQLGSCTVVCMLLGELDCPVEFCEDVYIIVGSDEGYTETTMFRVAALINDVAFFLQIGPLVQTNVHLLRMVLEYIDERMGVFDLGFLTQAMETVFNPGVTATGFSSTPDELLDELMESNIFQGREPDERMPGFALVIFGNKTLMETTSKVAEEAAKANKLSPYTLQDGDRYIIHLITSAFFAVHRKKAESRARRIRHLEHVLLKFEVHRHNVERRASKQAIDRYCKMLRLQDEVERADFFQMAFEELLLNVKRVVDSNRYHIPSVDLDFDEPFTVSNCCFRNSNHVGFMQLLWTPNPQIGPDDEPLMVSVCPQGHGCCVVYFPPKNDKEHTTLQEEFPSFVPTEQLDQLAGQVVASSDLSFNRFQWLLSPPVDSYDAPGLVHFVSVDRRDNSCICGSFDRMTQQKNLEVCYAVTELRRTMSQCISKAQEYVSQGFSEGLWGHLGLQFFFSIGISGSDTGSQQQQVPQRNTNIARPAATENIGLFGEAKRIPSNVLDHLALRPMLLPDVLEDNKQMKIVEIYCMFVGCLSPQEVCQSVEWLRGRLFS
jgi:hypothetical protein